MILLNGSALTCTPARPSACVLTTLALGRDARGVAVAVDGEVVPRACGKSYTVGEERAWRC